MVQSIPLDVNHTHVSLHDVNRKGKPGFDWVQKHATWIVYWNNKATYMPRVPIDGGHSTSPDYMQWYNRITPRLISPDQYTAGSMGYQPSRSASRDLMYRMFLRLKVSSSRARLDDRASMEHLYNTTHQYVEEMEPIIQVPPYLVEATAPQRRRSSARRDDVGASGSRSQRRRSSAGPHDLHPHFTPPQPVPTSYGTYPVHGINL
ncbi:hypothetical protein ACS0TY_025775 [Phlomoides rotata]